MQAVNHYMLHDPCVNRSVLKSSDMEKIIKILQVVGVHDSTSNLL